jgi:hypothetical protein
MPQTDKKDADLLALKVEDPVDSPALWVIGINIRQVFGSRREYDVD